MSKEENILNLFYNEPTKHWHFEVLLKAAKISRPQAVQWLKKFIKRNLIQRIKERGKMPYYLAQFDSPHYKAAKRVYALQQFEKSGFLAHLISLPKAKTVIIFGSMVRGDWYTDSDIDVFIYGNAEGLHDFGYGLKLKREIQVFECETEKNLEKYRPGLLRNISEGYIIKGELSFIKVAPFMQSKN